MAQSFNTNLFNVTKHYLKLLNVPVTNTTLKEILVHNPYYPSLYSINQVCTKLGVDNAAYTLEVNDFHQFTPPFIAYCSGQNTGKDFVLVTKVSENTVSYISKNSKPQEITKELFFMQWQRLISIAEATAKSGEDEYEIKRKTEWAKSIKLNLLYTGVVMVVGLMIYSFIRNVSFVNQIAAGTITLIKVLGIAVTGLLLMYEIDKNNSFVKNICSAGKQTNCDAVLNSKQAKFLGMGWGEIGFFYFATTTLFLLLPNLGFASKLSWIAIAGSLAAFYILFSIYYQWRVVKQWCPLCLATQTVLAMELVWAISFYWTMKPQNPFNNLDGLIHVMACFVFVFVAWYLLKPFFIAFKSSSDYQAAYKRLVYNPEIFKSLLQQQNLAPEGWEELGINIGNPTAATTILKVCNPYCPPCAKAHPILEEIIENNPNVKVKIIFNTSNKDDVGKKPVKHLLAIAAKKDPMLVTNALDDWYLPIYKDYEMFAAKYPMNGELKEQEINLTQMSEWCDKAEITATPTFFINGNQLPQAYNINELKKIF